MQYFTSTTVAFFFNLLKSFPAESEGGSEKGSVKQVSSTVYRQNQFHMITCYKIPTCLHLNTLPLVPINTGGVQTAHLEQSENVYLYSGHSSV